MKFGTFDGWFEVRFLPKYEVFIFNPFEVTAVRVFLGCKFSKIHYSGTVDQSDINFFLKYALQLSLLSKNNEFHIEREIVQKICMQKL